MRQGSWRYFAVAADACIRSAPSRIDYQVGAVHDHELKDNRKVQELPETAASERRLACLLYVSDAKEAPTRW